MLLKKKLDFNDETLENLYNDEPTVVINNDNFNSNVSENNNKNNLVIICSGNGGGYEIFHLFGFWTKYYMSRKVNVLLWNYQSFGDSEGSTDFNNIRNDVKRLINKLTQFNRWDKIMIHGISLGGVASTYSTSLNNNDKRIELFFGDRTFSSIRNIVKSYYCSGLLVKLFDFFMFKLGNSYTVKDLKSNINLIKIIAFDPNDTIIPIQGSLITGMSMENYFLKFIFLINCYDRMDNSEIKSFINKNLYKYDESYLIDHLCQSSQYNVSSFQLVNSFEELRKIVIKKENNQNLSKSIEKIKITDNLGDISINDKNDIHLSHKFNKVAINDNKISSEYEMNQIENPLLNLSERINKSDSKNVNNLNKKTSYDKESKNNKNSNNDNKDIISNLSLDIENNLNSSNVNNQSSLSNFSRLNQIDLSNSIIEISEFEFVERVFSCFENLESCGINFSKGILKSNNVSDFLNIFLTNLLNWGSFYSMETKNLKVVVNSNNFQNEYILLAHVSI